MGAEDFEVMLASRLPRREAATLLLSMPDIRHDADALPIGGIEFFVFECSELIAEVELDDRTANCGLVLRFAVCHPASGAIRFVQLVQEVARLLSATAISILDDVPAGFESEFVDGDWTGLATSLQAGIDAKRALWVADFGSDEAVVRTRDALQRFVLRTVAETRP